MIDPVGGKLKVLIKVPPREMVPGKVTLPLNVVEPVNVVKPATVPPLFLR
jgi:hypothetical protein